MLPCKLWRNLGGDNLNTSKNKRMLFILLIIILLTCCVLIITSAIKSFNEWNRPLGSYKSEIITKYKENKNDFTDLVSYMQSIESEVAIERNEDTNYKSYKYGDGIKYYNIDDKLVDTNLRKVFNENFISIDKDRGAVYFVFRNDVGGSQGVAYTDDPKKLVRYSGIEIEKIGDDWYYFIGQ